MLSLLLLTDVSGSYVSQRYQAALLAKKSQLENNKLA